MPLLSEIERRSPVGRLIMGTIYLLLILGGISMVYPFMLMIGTSMTSHADNEEFTAWPAYLTDNTALFQKYLAERYDQDVAVYNQMQGESYVSFTDIEGHEVRPGDRARAADIEQFIDGEIRPGRIALTHVFYRKYRYRVLAAYNDWLGEKFGDLDTINRRYGETEHYPGQFQFPYDAPLYRLPFTQDSAKEKDWRQFKREVPWSWICLPSGHGRYRMFLNERYMGLGDLNRVRETRLASVDDVWLPWERPSHPVRRADWEAFVAKVWPQHLIEPDGSLLTPTRLWAGFLQRTYAGNLERLNAAHHARYASFDAAPIPYGSADRIDFGDSRGQWRWDFMTGNYATIFDFLFVHGRAGFNTLVLVLGTILLQLTVNPLCAYALSRFKLSTAFSILLFCLATMSFPAEVAMIPNFLLMKEFHLLNTYWALLLPTAANGFFIFLLKGFFDSLPDELFEAASLDGAGPLGTFWRIAVPLCKPVLAVIALQAFVVSYGSFMWAYVVCQDADLWTLMVYIHQLQIGNPVHLVMAALTLASFPTLIVFLLCQRIILRGIVVPTMK